MLTEFGKFVRKLRIDKGMMLGEMAKSMSLSSAYLSAVENGKKKIPTELVEKIIYDFALDENQSKALLESVENSPVVVKINLKESPSDERVLVSEFARQVADLSIEQKSDIFQILNRRKGG